MYPVVVPPTNTLAMILKVNLPAPALSCRFSGASNNIAVLSSKRDIMSVNCATGSTAVAPILPYRKRVVGSLVLRPGTIARTLITDNEQPGIDIGGKIYHATAPVISTGICGGDDLTVVPYVSGIIDVLDNTAAQKVAEINLDNDVPLCSTVCDKTILLTGTLGGALYLTDLRTRTPVLLTKQGASIRCIDSLGTNERHTLRIFQGTSDGRVLCTTVHQRDGGWRVISPCETLYRHKTPLGSPAAVVHVRASKRRLASVDDGGYLLVLRERDRIQRVSEPWHLGIPALLEMNEDYITMAAEGSKFLAVISDDQKGGKKGGPWQRLRSAIGKNDDGGGMLVL